MVSGSDKNPWGDDPWGDGSGDSGKSSAEDDLGRIASTLKDKVKKFTAVKKGGGKGGSNGNYNTIILFFIGIAFILWLVTGFFTVNTKEEGVVLRFGKYVRTAGPGLNYHFPVPIEKVIKVRVTDRYKEEIGYKEAQRGRITDDSREILMLTGDENIVNINLEVQWQIADSRKFLFNVYDPRGTVRYAAESAMREVVGTTPINEILSEGRTAVQLQTKNALQHILDSYDAGIKIEQINMKGIPPAVVDEAFKDVQAAKINKEETINKAIAYNNEVIPRARGESARLLEQAEAYKRETVARAEGEAERFVAIHRKYLTAKDVTKRRMYLETMENILKGTEKIIIDKTAGKGVLPYLPLQEMKTR